MDGFSEWLEKRALARYKKAEKKRIEEESLGLFLLRDLSRFEDVHKTNESADNGRYRPCNCGDLSGLHCSCIGSRWLHAVPPPRGTLEDPE